MASLLDEAGDEMRPHQKSTSERSVRSGRSGRSRGSGRNRSGGRSDSSRRSRRSTGRRERGGRRRRSPSSDEEQGGCGLWDELCKEPSSSSRELRKEPTGSSVTPVTSPRAITEGARREAAKSGKKGEATEDYQLQQDAGYASVSKEGEFDPDCHFKQRFAILSGGFILAQTAILGLMMWQCGVAPMKINPMLGPYPDALNYWGAKNAVLIIEDGESWRLFTPIFLHAGVIHLMGNVMVQQSVGNTWEKEWGSLVWAIVYIGSAFGSSVFSTCFMPDNISVGSSGAVMGLFGAKFAEILLLCCERSTNVKEKADERSRKRQLCLVVSGMAICAAMSFIPYVDWAAHLGGMLAGFVVGMVVFSFKIRSWFFVLLWLVVGVGSAVALYSVGMAYMYTSVEAKDELRDVCGYYQQFYEDYECKCMIDEAIEFGSWQFGGGGNNGGGGEGGGENQ